MPSDEADDEQAREREEEAARVRRQRLAMERMVASGTEAKVEQGTDPAIREAEIAASWSKEILTEGAGEVAWKGARAEVHIIGRADAMDEPFEDSYARGMPRLISMGIESRLPAGLDRALLTMRAGEKAKVTVASMGGYGKADAEVGYMLRAATLVYDVELVSLSVETDVTTMSNELKLERAAERKQRGNLLFTSKHHVWACAEYEHAGRYLALMIMCTEEEQEKREVALVAANLNLAVAKLRLGLEAEAIDAATAVLELRPNEAKAYFRIGQAHAQTGEYDQALEFLAKAETAAEGDEERLKPVRVELDKVRRKKKQMAREQKATYKRMFPKEPPKPPPANIQEAATLWHTRLRDWTDFHPVFSRTLGPALIVICFLGPIKLFMGSINPMYVMAISCLVLWAVNRFLPNPEEGRNQDVQVKVKVRKEEDFNDKMISEYHAKEKLQKYGKGR